MKKGSGSLAQMSPLRAQYRYFMRVPIGVSNQQISSSMSFLLLLRCLSSACRTMRKPVSRFMLIRSAVTVSGSSSRGISLSSGTVSEWSMSGTRGESTAARLLAAIDKDKDNINVYRIMRARLSRYRKRVKCRKFAHLVTGNTISASPTFTAKGKADYNKPE